MSRTHKSVLSKETKELLKAVFRDGPLSLYDAGWDDGAVAKLLTSLEARGYLKALASAFNTQEFHGARARFLTRRELYKLSGGAAAVLRRALRGPLYLKRQDGGLVFASDGQPVVLDMGPTREQVFVAMQIIDKIGGVDETLSKDRGVDLDLHFLEAATDMKRIEITYDPGVTTPGAQALSRERIRTAMARLSPKVKDAQVELLEGLGTKKKKKKKTIWIKKKKVKRRG